MTRFFLILGLGICCAAHTVAAADSPAPARSVGPVFAEIPPTTVGAGSVVAPASNPAATTNETETALADDKHRLVSGDAVNFRIVEDRDPPNTPQKVLVVSDSGELDVPYIGLVKVERKTCREAKQEITRLLEKDYYYKATVILGLVSGTKLLGRVYVYGEVRIPGPVLLPPNETFSVSKAIVGAGGFGEFAKKNKVQVIQNPGPEQKVMIVDMEEVFEKAMTEKDVTLNSGDRVFVPKRGINF